MHRALVAVFLGVLLCAASSAHAQGVRIRAVRRDTIVVGSTVTAAFGIANQRTDSIAFTPRVAAPQGWTVLMGTAPLALAPGSADVLMVSVVVPARAAAGVYPIHVSVAGARDSAVVVVPHRRSLEVALLDRPGFVVSGKSYDAGFLVRNRGNVPAIVRVAARSTLGVASLIDTLFTLSAEESRAVRARVRTPSGLSAAADDVLEIVATQFGDTSAAHSSARLTVVPEPSRKIEEFLKVPTHVNLRAASSDAVSPFEIFGQGRLRDGGATQLDFAFRGPTGKFSAFGERDEYRIQLKAPSWQARVGDHVYMMTPLTGAAQPGLGASVDATRGAFTAGAHGQQFRRALEKGSEAAAFVRARPRDDASVGLQFVTREGGLLAGNVGSAVAGFSRDAFNADVELAGSNSSSGPGRAGSARVNGASSSYSFDFGHQQADTGFSGAQRGAEHTYLTASSHRFDRVAFAANGGTHRSDLSRSTGVPYVERLDVGMLSATLFDRYTLELGSVMRGTTVSGVTQKAHQRGLRARAEHELIFGSLSLESEVGQASDALLGSRVYNDVSVSARRSVRSGGVAVWGERYSGGSITKGTDATVTLGGDASVRMSRTMDLTFMGYATRVRSSNPSWHSQIDALISHALPNGSRISLRARLIGGGTLTASEQSVAYLEYGIPLRLPVSRLRTPGRVYGRVVDAVSGNGVSGALVRLGPQVAITDRQGQVSFGGVPGGEHRLSMSQETTLADAVFVGDPTLMVDSTRTRPTTFQFGIARSARLDIDVRRFGIARTGVAGAVDSLASTGPLANATLMLAGERDTLYRTTKDDGTASFTDIPPGAWVVSIRGDAPAFHRFDPDRLDVILSPGETRSLSFRLVPRRREVQLIGDGQELRNEAADPKAPAAPVPVAKTRKPDENRPHEKRPD